MGKVIAIMIGLLGVCTAQAQEALTAGKCFAELPEGLISVIDKNTRLDMLDYYRAGSDKASSNMLGGECRVLGEEAESISYQVSDGCRGQIFVLNADSATPLIGLIETLDTPIADSMMALYNSRWITQRGLFEAPQLADWLTKEGKKRRAEVEDALPFIMASYAYDPETHILTVSNNTEEYFHPTDRPDALSLVQKELRYKWNGKKFALVK